MSEGSGKWSYAFSLHERMDYWNRTGIPALEPQELALSKKRVQTWYAQEPFEDNQYFDAFLDQNGWVEETFINALGCNPSRITSESEKLHKWWQTIEECYELEPEFSADNSTIETNNQFAGLINLVSPLIKVAECRLMSHVEALAATHPRVPFQVSEIVALWKADLPEQLLLMLSKTLILELNIARLRNRLQGSTSHERFTAFALQLRNHSFSLAILQEYPVLARKLYRAVQQWECFGYAFFNHLYTDFEALVNKLLAGKLPGSIQKIKQGTGDRHNDGKSVVQIHFSSGARLVYKPRPLTIDFHFQQLLNRLNEEYNWTPFKPVNILDRDGYGWMEFVPTKECKDLVEVHKFYRRHGALLALLYALESTDFHFENLIANGEFPVLIDLESLFQPRFDDAVRQDGVQIANRTAVFSVLRVGLLPQRIFSRDNTIGVEVSGIGAEPGQMTPNRIPQWDNVATDKMHLIRERVPMPSANNRPMLNGKDVNTINFVADINFWC